MPAELPPEGYNGRGRGEGTLNARPSCSNPPWLTWGHFTVLHLNKQLPQRYKYTTAAIHHLHSVASWKYRYLLAIIIPHTLQTRHVLTKEAEILITSVIYSHKISALTSNFLIGSFLFPWASDQESVAAGTSPCTYCTIPTHCIHNFEKKHWFFS